MTIGWVITQSNLSGVSEFLNVNGDSEYGWSWSTVPKKATIFLERHQVDYWFEEVLENHTSNTTEIVPVEIHY